jgi:hypothetical protein
MSLVGKLDGTRMGDRHQRTRPVKAAERKAKYVSYIKLIVYRYSVYTCKS